MRVYTSSGTSGPVYIANAVTLPAAQSSMSFGATALYSGSAGNAAAGVFSLSNFTNYTESTYGSLLVTNHYGIVGGSDAETDDNYRYRIQLKLQGQNGANEAALRFQILMIPGIQDVVFAAAAGTFTCYVYGIASDGSAALLQNVQTAIDNTVAFPLTGSAGISLTTTITLTASASSAPDPGSGISEKLISESETAPPSEPACACGRCHRSSASVPRTSALIRVRSFRWPSNMPPPF